MTNSSEFSLRELKIEVTHQCLLSCSHCSSSAGSTCQTSIRRNVCEEIVEQAAQLGVSNLAFSGGEPLLWPGLPAVIRTAKASGISVTVYTSGNVDGAAARIDELIEAGVARFALSVFGSTPPIHDSITRTQGSLAQTERAMSQISTSGTLLDVHFVPMTGTYRELPAVANLGFALGAKQVSVLRFVPHGRGRETSAHALNATQNEELRLSILALRKRGHAIRTGSPYNFLGVNDAPVCHAGIDRLIVTPDLRIHPCDGFKQIRAETLVGDSMQYSSLANNDLATCWAQSPYLKAVREIVQCRPLKHCGKCPQYARCGSGCLAQKVIASGKLHPGPDPDCLRQELAEDACACL